MLLLGGIVPSRVVLADTIVKITLDAKSYTYNGKAKKPKATVKIDGEELSPDDYDLTYDSGRKDAGKYKVTVDLKGNYSGSASATFTIQKAKQSMTVKIKTVSVKYSKVKTKKQTLAISKVMTIKKAKGTKTYKKLSGSKYLTINKKTGKITIKKGAPKKTHKIKIKVTAKGTKNYGKGSKTVTVKIKVK